MLHKYLLLRGKRYYFRWRIPSDLQKLFGVTELIQSLYTTNEIQAYIRAKRYTELVVAIKATREAYFTGDIDESDCVRSIKNYWFQVCCMTKRSKTFKTGLITYAGFTFDFDGDLDKELLALKKTKEMGLLPKSTQSEVAPTNSHEKKLLFSELFEGFILHKADQNIAKNEGRKPLSEMAQKEYRRYFGSLLEIISDIAISMIDRSMVKNALMTYKQLPKRNKKAYKGLPVSELLEMDIPPQDIISNKTVEAVRKLLQGIFRYAVDSNYIETSPARDLNLKLDVSNTFAAYTKHEVITMLVASANEKKLWQKWLPLIAAYTGARRSELVQLRKQDIKFDSDSKRYYILITDAAGDVKTENAIRQVPIHQELISAGFLDFVKSTDNKLFDGLKPHSVTSWFARFGERLGIEKFDDFGNRKVFHSFRHTFVTLSRGAGNSLDSVQQVVGHEKTSAGITDRYSHRIPITDVLSVVDKVIYE